MAINNNHVQEIDHFSKLEHIWWGAKTPAGQKRYDYKFDLLKRLCKPKPKAKILEIGCGDGEFTKRLSRLDATIIATDLTPKVIQRAEENYSYKNVKFKIVNAEKLHYNVNTFDIVCGISILHHLDSEKALKECRKVLKKDGAIFFTEPNLINPQIFLGLNLPYLRKRMEFSNNEVAFVRWNLEKLIKRSGFKNIIVENYDFLHPDTPSYFIPFIKNISGILERIPLVKEVSGSLYIYATK